MGKSAVEKLRELVEKRGRAPVLQETGLSKQYLSNLLSGRKPFALNARQRFEEAMGLPAGFFGSGSNDLDGYRPAGHLPLLTAAQVGTTALDDAAESVWFDPRHLSSQAFALLIESDSMVSPSPIERSIQPGSHVAIDPAASPRVGDYVLARTPLTEQPVVRKLIADGGRMYLAALNPRFTELIPVAPDVQIIGRVMSVVTQL